MAKPAEAQAAPALVLAPLGRDAQAIARVLAEMGQPVRLCRDVATLCSLLGPDAAMVLLTEEALASGIGSIRDCLDVQPPWSDLPIVVLSAGGERRGGAARWNLFGQLGNVTVLDRPLHVGVLQSAVRAALRARRRQFQTRIHLEELEEARTTLEARVQAEVAERRKVESVLLRAQQLEAIGQLTGGIAHDFNNLLQVVTGGMTLIGRFGLDGERGQRILAGMWQASDRGAKLTQQLLAFARRQALASVAIDVSERVEGMFELLRGSLRADIVLEREFASDLWMVEADPTQLEIALINLMINARDAMPQGGTVSIRARNVSRSAERDGEALAGDFVSITVADAGHGMDQATLQRVFEPFFTTKEVGAGTGLGLSQVYGFCRQSGGNAQIRSEVGRGTEVSLYLPRTTRPPEIIETQLPPVAHHAGGIILVVEDEPNVAASTCALLEELGYSCRHVASAEAALESDLAPLAGLFSDVILAGPMDGITLAQELRRRRPELPVLLATGFAGAPDRLAGSGFPVLKKPYGLGELSAMAARAFSPKPAPQASEG